MVVRVFVYVCASWLVSVRVCDCLVAGLFDCVFGWLCVFVCDCLFGCVCM